MCGIAGIIDFKAPVAQHRESLLRMVSALNHRGPDESGVVIFDDCALGHARLAIIDISSGQQPMRSALNDAIAITFNGEIYGYKETREKLSDYNFRTSSDTELIIALYHKHSKSLLSSLPGIFSFGIWDDEKRELFCARDRFGEKPFYYAWGYNDVFIFASEIKAIISSGLIDPIIDPQSVSHYLKKLYVHPHKTIYKNIFALAPAQTLSYNEKGVSTSFYWKLPKVDYKISLPDAIDRFSDLLDSAVKRQLVADVEVGAFLSGGLDSSTIVAIASRHANKIKTISFGFENSINELPYAKRVAEKYGTAHIELRDIDFDIGNLLLEMQKIYDEPFADSSSIPTYLICREAKKHLSVVLTGDGGDELLAGYSYWYRPLYEMGKKAEYRSFIKKMLFMLFSVVGKIRRPAELHYTHNLYFKNWELRNIFINDRDIIEKPDLSSYNYNNVDDAMRMDVEDYMPGDILVKTDRASMASSVELRAPFLDVDFASFCLTLPYSLKIDEDKDKLILRKAFGKYWPVSIASRQKQGFGAPVSDWLRSPDIVSLKNCYLEKPSLKIYEFLDFHKAKRYLNQNTYKTWILLVLSLWLETR